MTGPACRESASQNKAGAVTKHPRASAARHLGYRTAVRREPTRGSPITTDLPILETMRRLTLLVLVMVTAALAAPAVAGASKLIVRNATHITLKVKAQEKGGGRAHTHTHSRPTPR